MSCCLQWRCFPFAHGFPKSSPMVTSSLWPNSSKHLIVLSLRPFNFQSSAILLFFTTTNVKQFLDSLLQQVISHHPYSYNQTLSSNFNSLILHIVGIEPLKTRHDVTKSHLIVLLLSLLCINIDLSIQLISLTLYMTWVY